MDPLRSTKSIGSKILLQLTLPRVFGVHFRENHRVTGPPDGGRISTLCLAVLTQCRSVTDGRTDCPRSAEKCIRQVRF